ncbi:unnamed protein product [Clonostachys rosea f. rosea IK726]|nr:unnamed protein product [Clonostachys rosea f. rosea IK726]
MSRFVQLPVPVGRRVGSALSGSATASASVVSKTPRRNIPQDALSNPHHVTRNGKLVRFKNPYPSFSHDINPFIVARAMLWPALTGKRKFPDTSNPGIRVLKPQWPSGHESSSKLRATWLGHACYYVEFPSGLRVLYDPVFEERCSPLPFMGPKRYTPAPCTAKDIPLVDIVVISHSHYDHLSIKTVQALKDHHPNAHFLVPLGLEAWFRHRGFKNVTEFDWWEDAELTVRTDDGEIAAKVSCLPAQHATARSLFDENKTLWSSFAITSGGKSVWFAGDTGYRGIKENPDGASYDADFSHLPHNPQFEQIGKLRGPFDLGLIPIGAYSPRMAFSAVHGNPYDAVEIFKDTKCQRAMGIHWGTWALTMEDVLDPPRLLKDALRRSGIAEQGVFDVCDIGESREF